MAYWYEGQYFSFMGRQPMHEQPSSSPNWAGRQYITATNCNSCSKYFPNRCVYMDDVAALRHPKLGGPINIHYRGLKTICRTTKQ